MPAPQASSFVQHFVGRRCALTASCIVLFYCCALLSAVLYGQEIDSRKDRRAPAFAPMRWENLASELQHVAGNPVVHSRAYKLNVVTLEPGQYVDFQVPDHEYIRVQSCSDEHLTDGQTEIFTSNGTGLFRKLKPAHSENQKLLIAAPDQSGISLGRVMRAPYAASAITVAVFTSTRQPARLLDYYQCSVVCDQPQVEVSDDRARRPRYYTPVRPGKRYALEVDGNTRLRLESRLNYDSDASQHQFYWIKIFYDGIYHPTVLFDTVPQRMHRQFIDGTEKLIGQREFAYLDIESENRAIEIEVSHPVLLNANAIGLKLVNPLINHQYNPPAWEAQLLDEDAWLEKDFLDDGKTLDDYLANGVDRQRHAPNPYWDPWLNYPKLLGVARDNNIRYGGLRSYMWMRSIASRRHGESNFGDELTVAELARKIRHRFTYFRDLLPIDLHGSTNPRYVSFPVRSIRRAKQAATETTVGQQHIDEQAARLATTTLYQISTGGWQDPNSGQDCQCGDLIYRPAEGLGASLVRVIVDRQRMTGNAKLWIQYDERPPFELSLLPNSALKTSAFVPGRAEAAVASLAETHQRYDSGPWGGPFSVLKQPVAMIDAAVAEFVLPPSVKQIKISAESDTDETLHVGLQNLVANFTELSELAYRKHGRQASRVPAMKEFSGGQLNNNSIDVQRLLTSHQKQMDKSITLGHSFENSGPLWHSKQQELHHAKALEMAEAGNWPGVLEVLTGLIAHSEGDSRRQAIITRSQVLEQLGEDFLADRERRGWFKYSKDETLKKAMLETLLAQAAEEPAGDGLKEMFLSYGVDQLGGQDLEIRFAQQLADNGRHRFALLSIPPTASGPEVDEMVLRCSFQLRWWKTFKEALKRIENIERRNFWGAMKAMHIGQYERAFRLLDAAGEEGQQWLKHWKYGDYIFTRLSSPEFLTRMSAIEDWESWLAKHPGRRLWKPERGLVSYCQGAATIYSLERDLRMEFSRVDEGDVSTIRVHGPAKIRLECRPLHQAGSQQDWQHGQRPAEQALSGVLEISNSQQLERVPIINNVASDTLAIDGLRHLYLPGKRVFAELQIPAGLNELKLTSRNLDLLFRVQVQRPEVMSPVLPPITETSLAAVALGKFGPRCELLGEASDDAIGTDSVRLVSREQKGKSLDHPFRRYYGGEFDLETLRPHLNSQLGDIPTWQNRIHPGNSLFELLGQDEIDKRAISLVYDQPIISGNQPTLPLLRIALMESMVKANPQHKLLADLLGMLKTGSTWKRFEQFDRRAGIYLEKRDSWRPLSPKTRTRKTLLGVERIDRAVVGETPVEIDLSKIFAPEIEFTLVRPRVGFLPMQDTVVYWEVDGKQDSVTLKSHRQIEKFRIQLSPRSERITFWQPQPWANHYVAVNVDEVLPDGSVSPTGTPASEPEVKSWHVATADEPLTFRGAGPSVFRIDQLVDDEVHTRIVPVTEGDKTFELVPEDGDRIARYRIFQLDAADSVSPVFRPSVKTENENRHWVHEAVDDVFAAAAYESEVQPVGSLDLLSLRGPDADPVEVDIDDVTQIGVHDSGTIGFRIGYRQRRVIDEFPTEQLPGRFFDVNFSHRKYDPWKDEYRQSNFLIRPRIGSGPTFGLNHQRTRNLGTVNQRCDNSADGQGPLQLNWRVYAFGQHAGTPIQGFGNSFPWTAGLSGGLSRRYHISPHLSHRPSVNFFARYLSETGDLFSEGELDRDIFTIYKLNHRYGLRLSDQFTFQRYLDRRFYVRPMLTTNEDQLVPDNAGFAIGTDHLLGALQVHLAYRLTGFLSDNDRTETNLQNVVRIDLKSEKWSEAGFRSEVDFSLIHEINGGTSVGIFFSRYFNDARLYRDFRPGTILFRSLKQERAANFFTR